METIYYNDRMYLRTKIFFLFCCGFLLFSDATLWAQMNFTQTLTVDFNKGFLNNAVVSDDNVYNQFTASNVGNWQATTDLPQALSGHRMAAGNNKYVYLVGGATATSFSAAVYVATIQTSGISVWTALNPLPTALKDPAVVVGAGALYVIGGRNTAQQFNTIYYAAINNDGTIGAWQTSTVTLLSTLWGHSAVYLNGMIYIAGGSSGSLENSASSAVYYLKLKADNSIATVMTGTSLPAERNMNGMVTYNGKLYIMGGYDNSGTKMNTVYYATPDVNGATGSWTEGAPLPVPLSNHAVIVSNGLVMVLAGATAASYSSTVYYANAEQPQPWNWVTSSNLLYEPTRDGSAFQGNGIIFYAGGTNISELPVLGCRFANLTLTTNYTNHGIFISYPFYELGTERLIISLSYTCYFNAPWANCKVSYRTAPSNKIWGDWSALTATSPIPVSETRQYLQYRVELTGQTIYRATFNDLSLMTPGTPISGVLNSYTSFTQAASPYWVTSDISFTTGTHTFEPGTALYFAPGAGLTISQASMICNGSMTDSVKFCNQGIETGKWDGLYFDLNSDNGVSSQLYYTAVQGAGFGTNNANIYCNQTNEPLLSHCSIRNADGDAIRLATANINLQYTSIRGNTENGANLDLSSPSFVSCSLSYNGLAGVYLNSNTATYTGTTIDHNQYGFRFSSPNLTISMPVGPPLLSDNTFNGFAFNTGDITSSGKTWNWLPYDYFILGNVRIVQSGTNVRLTIKPGITLRFEPGTQIQVGAASNGGELQAIGTPDSLITFTSRNGLSGGWTGIYFQDANDNYSGTSVIKYCKIEKGTTNNLLCESSTQPLLDHCILSQATGNGLKLTSAPIVIRSTTFSANAAAGLYLDGTTNTGIGNNTPNSCSFYGNGTYAVYNNTTNNINAKYNYWGTDDSTEITSRIYDKYDNSPKGYVYFSPFATIPNLLTATMLLSGNVLYANAGASPMNNASLALKNIGDTLIAFATTNNAGSYAFVPLTCGGYKMVITPSDPWGGVNSTDALVILNHFTQTSLLTGINLKAADVNSSKTVNATDALFVMKRYTGMITSFPSGDYFTKCDTLIINNNQVIDNYRMICFGDVNASFSPESKQYQSTVSLEYEGSLVVTSFTEFEFPVKMKTGIEVGAISLGFHFPDEYLEITDAQLSNGCNTFSWTAENGLFRMAWCDQLPLVLADNEIFVFIHMKTKDLSSLNMPIQLGLYEDCEFADSQAGVAPDVIITVPVISSLLTGNGDPLSQAELSIIINPGGGIVMIGITLPDEATLNISLFDLLGNLVARKTEENMSTGRHSVGLHTESLATAVYFLKIDMVANHQIYSKVAKIVVSK